LKAWIRPGWDAPRGVCACTTTRTGGVSRPPYDSLNLSLKVDDDPGAVAQNRALLRRYLPAAPGWVEQEHGARVARRENLRPGIAADALICSAPGLPCAILTADCLPVLFCDRAGTRVAVAHAGWRGLAAGILEATVEGLDTDPQNLLAWLGPGIGAAAYEVGPDFEVIMKGRYPHASGAIRRRHGRLCADLYAIAGAALRGVGVRAVTGGGFCTYTEKERFFSHRRDGRTGRMATVIWLT